MFSIVLIGMGQLGSRYLQGLVKIEDEIKIIAVDPVSQAREVSLERWLEVGGDKSKHKIEWVSDLNNQKSNINLAIIATTSLGRASLIEDVALKVNPQYWIIEKMLAKSSQDLNLIKIVTKKAKGAWVNIPRRLMTWHQQLKSRFYSQGPLRVTKTAGLWGMATNAIHFIDLVAWWTGESLLSINSEGLDQKWFESKRLDYFEVTGELIAKFSGGTELVLRSSYEQTENNSTSTAGELKVETSKKDIWIINEYKNTASSSKGEFLNGLIEYQSELTKPMVAKIILTGTCELPTISESSEQHEIFLNTMLDHWNCFKKSNSKEVPIT